MSNSTGSSSGELARTGSWAWLPGRWHTGTMFRPLCQFLTCAAAVLSPHPALPALHGQELATDEAARSAWSKLTDPQKAEVIEWYQSEVRYLPTFQNQLIDFVLKGQPQDPGLWPPAEAAPFYDPQTHAPAQPIARKALPVTSKLLAKKREQFFFRVPERALDSGWVYDYTTRELRRTQRSDDPERLFANALAGFPPNLDLAEALVEMQLDRGAEQRSLTAFAHAYTDRSGNVYTGLTLYDAWASGSNMEMPDIDTLGVVHDLDGDWKTYKAPVPGSKQRKLYDHVGELFIPAHRYRGLRHAMAMTFLSGYPKLRDGYGLNLDRLHALWDDESSTPAAMAERLPDAKHWKKFLEKWVSKTDRSKSLSAKGIARRDTLYRDSLWVRKKLLEVMIQAGHLEVKEPR